MKKRCHSARHAEYPGYGGRGIVVCDEWRDDYVAFRTWALSSGYDDKLTIDRIDNDGPYSPDNCRWTDLKTQARNRRTNRRVTVQGVTKTVAQWAEETGLSANVIYHRIQKLGWPPELAVSAPPQKALSRLHLSCPNCGHELKPGA